MTRVWTMLLIAGALLVPRTAGASDGYLNDIPNGQNRSILGREACGVCHLRPQGDGDRNPFGTAFENAPLTRKWSAIYMLDSDRDGQTNGFELGDPEGIWRRGATPARTTDLSNPGDELHVSCPPDYEDEACNRPDAGPTDVGFAPDAPDGPDAADGEDLDLGGAEDAGLSEDVSSADRRLPTLGPTNPDPTPDDDGCRCAGDRGPIAPLGWIALVGWGAVAARRRRS